MDNVNLTDNFLIAMPSLDLGAGYDEYSGGGR